MRSEYVVQVKGTVRSVQKELNQDLPTGEIEVAVASELIILNRSDPCLFRLMNYHEVGEETRLHYRYLDIRRPEMLERYEISREKLPVIYDVIWMSKDFIEIETPVFNHAQHLKVRAII